MLQVIQHCLKAQPQTLQPQRSLCRVNKKTPSAAGSMARFHREEQGTCLLSISKFRADDFTLANLTIQVFTEENSALYACRSQQTGSQDKLYIPLLLPQRQAYLQVDFPLLPKETFLSATHQQPHLQI